MTRNVFIGLFLMLCLSGSFAQAFSEQKEIALQDSTVKSSSSFQETILSGLRTDQLKISEKDIIKRIDSLPAFSIYKDNFFITGVSLHEKLSTASADAKFQISFRQRLTSSRLPFNTFLFLTYTQRSFWNIYQESSPFRDNNYNPGIGLGRYIVHDNKLKGVVFLQIEHESNGKDGTLSRDFNAISLSGKYFVNENLLLRLNLNAPFLLGEYNKDIVDYRGLGYFTAEYRTSDHKWWFSTTFNPRNNILSVNTNVSAAFKISDKLNQYLYMEFYNGTGDSMLNYKRYDLNVRVGICIKSDFYNAF